MKTPKILGSPPRFGGGEGPFRPASLHWSPDVLNWWPIRVETTVVSGFNPNDGRVIVPLKTRGDEFVQKHHITRDDRIRLGYYRLYEEGEIKLYFLSSRDGLSSYHPTPDKVWSDGECREERRVRPDNFIWKRIFGYSSPEFEGYLKDIAGPKSSA